MRRTLLRLFIGLVLSLLSFVIVLLFIPSVSRFVIEKTAAHYLHRNLNVTYWNFTGTRLLLSGTFDDNSTIDLEAFNLLEPERSITLRINANTTLFDAVAGTALPNIAFNAVARYRHPSGLTLDGHLLDGNLSAKMSMNTMHYDFRLDHLSIDRYLRDQELPAFLSGTLDLTGNGAAKSPFEQHAKLISNNLKLKSPLLSSLGAASLPKTLDANLSTDFHFRKGSELTADLQLSTVAFSLQGNRLGFNLAGGTFILPLSLHNNTISELPFRHLALTAIGDVSDENVNAGIIAETGEYLLLLNRLVYDMKKSSLHTAYRFSTLGNLPVDLGGKNALQGNLSLEDARQISITVGSENLKDPLEISFKNSRLSVISNNIPTKAIFSILRYPPLFNGHFTLDADVDLNTSPPSVNASLHSFDLVPLQNDPLAEDLNLTRPVHADLSVYNRKNRYFASLDVDSQLFRTHQTQMVFDSEAMRATLDSTLTGIALPGYRTQRLRLRSVVDLNRSNLHDTVVSSDFEHLEIPYLHFGGDMLGDFSFSARRLDRFSPDLNRSVMMEGRGRIASRNGKTAIHAATNLFGPLELSLAGDTIEMRLTDLDLDPLFRILNRPAPLQGKLRSVVRFENGALAATMHSDRLKPAKALEKTLRPFPLDIELDATRCRGRVFAKASLNTAADSITLSSLNIDLDRKSVNGNYLVNFHDLARSAIVFPEALGEDLLFGGELRAEDKRRYLTLKTSQIMLSPEVHAKIEANATEPLALSVELNASVEEHTFHLDAAAQTEPFTLAPLRLDYDLNRSKIRLFTALHTQKWLGDIDLDFSSDIDKNSTLRNGTLFVHNRHGDLSVSGLRVNTANEDIHADMELEIKPLVRSAVVHENAVVYARIDTRPAKTLSLHSDAFDGRFSALINENDLYVHAEHINLYRLANFINKTPLLKRGKIGGDIYLNTPALLAGDPGRLNGGVDIGLRDVLLQGIEIDGYLETLRNSQDFSLFQGSFSDLPIVRSVKNLPRDVLAESNVSTLIPTARFSLGINNGIAVCDDCAVATAEHRFAFAGDINLSSQRFSHFYFALLNPEGCPYFTQQIKGPLSKPEINLAKSGVKIIGGAVVSVASNVTDAANWLTGLLQKLTSKTGEVISYVPIAGKTTDKALNKVSGSLHKTTETVSGCTPFYLGKVPHPRKKKK